MSDYKESEKEKELNELFQINSSNSFEKVVKKAKRITLIRNIFISLFVVVFLFISFGFTWLSIMRWSQENAIRDIETFSRITRPNVEELGFQARGNGLFEGILYFDRYKEINGFPVNWSDNVVTYSLFGGVSRLSGNHSPIQLKDKNDGQTRYYDRETKQRIMEFYHPEVNYAQIRNDLSHLDQLSQETLVEMAISFDGNYTPEEVRELIPDGVTLEWYWVDTYTNMEVLKGSDLPELSTDIYGFDETHNANDPLKSEERFIKDLELGLSIERGKYLGEYQRIYNYLKGESSTLSGDNLNIIGVVVTGTAAELKTLEGLDMIRASVFGVTVAPYR